MNVLSIAASHKVNRRGDTELTELPSNCAPTSDRHIARRNQILDAAQACFIEHGFHSAGMSKIADSAKMSVGHIYHYFANKDAIIAAIVERESAIQVAKFAQTETLTADELVEFLLNKLDNTVRNELDPLHSALDLEILAEGQRNLEIATIVRRHDERMREGFARMLSKQLGQEDAESRTEVLFALFNGLQSRVLRHPEIDRDSLIKSMRATVSYLIGR